MADRATVNRRNRERGKEGERAFCRWLREWQRGGVDVSAERTRQYDGNMQPDIEHNVSDRGGTPIHFEVTVDRAVSVGTAGLRKKYLQAAMDCPTAAEPMVAHPCRGGWLFTYKPWSPIKGQPLATVNGADWMEAEGYTR